MQARRRMIMKDEIQLDVNDWRGKPDGHFAGHFAG